MPRAKHQCILAPTSWADTVGIPGIPRNTQLVYTLNIYTFYTLNIYRYIYIYVYLIY